jgi:hypothetical protein
MPMRAGYRACGSAEMVTARENQSASERLITDAAQTLRAPRLARARAILALIETEEDRVAAASPQSLRETVHDTQQAF